MPEIYPTALAERTSGRGFRATMQGEVPFWDATLELWRAGPVGAIPGLLDPGEVPMMLYDEAPGVIGYTNVSWDEANNRARFRFNGGAAAAFGNAPAETGGIRLSQGGDASVVSRNFAGDGDYLVLQTQSTSDALDNGVVIGDRDFGGSTNLRGNDGSGVGGEWEILFAHGAEILDGARIEGVNVGVGGGLLLKGADEANGDGHSVYVWAGDTSDDTANGGDIFARAGTGTLGGGLTRIDGGEASASGAGVHAGGALLINAGAASGTGGGGTYLGAGINIFAGSGETSGGDILLSAGATGDGGSPGDFDINAGEDTVNLLRGNLTLGNFTGGSYGMRIGDDGGGSPTIGYHGAAPIGQLNPEDLFTDAGTPSGTNTLVDVGAAPTQANINNNFATIAVFLNVIIDWMTDIGYMETP